MGLFDKLFGKNKEEQKPVSQPDTNEKQAEETKVEEKTQAEEPKSVSPISEQEKKDTPANNTKVDLSKFTFHTKNQQESPRDSMRLNLNLNLGDGDLTESQREAIIQSQCFGGQDGVGKFGESTISENIFITAFLQHSMIPKAVQMMEDAQEKNDKATWEQRDRDRKVFLNFVSFFGRILAAKVLTLPKVWVVYSNTTSYPFSNGGWTPVFISEKPQSKFKEMLNTHHFDIDIREVDGAGFLSFIDSLKANGFNGISLVDGTRVEVGANLPLPVWKQNVNNDENSEEQTEEEDNKTINPELQASIIDFAQEMKRNVDYEGCKVVRDGMQARLLSAIHKANYLLPIDPENENPLAELPIIDPKSGQETGNTVKMLSVFTDEVEMSKEYSGEGFGFTIATFEDVAEKVNELELQGFVINNGSLKFPVGTDNFDAVRNIEKAVEINQNAINTISKIIDEKQTVWIPVSLTTGYPFSHSGKSFMFLNKESQEGFMEDMKNDNFEIQMVEISPENIAEYIKSLIREGYVCVVLVDDSQKKSGTVTPLAMWMSKLGISSSSGLKENPRLQISMISFFQEIRRKIPENTPEDVASKINGMRVNMERTMMYELSKAEYILPVRMDANGQPINPTLDSKENPNVKMLAVFSDINEMRKAFPENQGWMMTPMSYGSVVNTVTTRGLSGYLINCQGLCIPVETKNFEVIDRLVKEIEQSQN